MLLPEGSRKTYDLPVPRRVVDKPARRCRDFHSNNIDPARFSMASVSSRPESCGGKGYHPATRTMWQPHNGSNDAGAISAFLTQIV